MRRFRMEFWALLILVCLAWRSDGESVSSAIEEIDSLFAAAQQARDALQRQPDDPERIAHLARLLMKLDEYEEVVRLYERLLALEPADPLMQAEAYSGLGFAHLQLNRLTQALEFYQKGMAIAPDLPHMYSGQGLAYERLNERVAAIAAFKKAVALDPNVPEPHYHLAQLYDAQANLDQALNHARLAVRTAPHWADAYALYGLLLFKKGILPEAVEALQQAIALDPLLKQPYRTLAQAYLRQGKRKQAAKLLEKLRELTRIDGELQLHEQRVRNTQGRTRVEALCNLGAVLFRQKRMKEAFRAYRRAWLLDPRCAEAYVGLGAVYAKLGTYEKALTAYRRAVALNPQLAEAHAGLGLVAVHQRRYEEAESHYRRASELKPDSPEVWLNLGSLYTKQKRWDRAIEAYRKVVALKPDSQRAYAALGSIYQNQGQDELAIATYQKLIELTPHAPGGYEALAKLYAERGTHLEEAVRLAKTALRLTSNAAPTLNLLAWIYYKKGDYREAEQTLLEALKQDPDNPLYLEGLQAIRRELRDPSR